MRIGINGRFLVAKRTGVQRAAYNLLKKIIEIDHENDYVIFTGYQEADSNEWKKSNVRVVPSHIQPANNLRNYMWEQIQLPRLAKKEAVDILHSPANMAPLLYSGVQVINIHDLCFIVNPDWYSFAFRTFYNFSIPKLVKRARRIITNSNNSRNDLFKYFGLGADKVSLIYWAVDDLFVTETPEVGRGGYILYVGSLEPRKNIASLVEAYELLRLQYPHLNVKLVLIGGESPLFSEVRLRAKRFQEDVLFKGFVTDEELLQYYRNANLVAYPSLYEGFGLPPLESMACGTPVITSNVSSLPEVVGTAAITVDPKNIHNLCEAMASVLLSEDLSTRMIKNGILQVAEFNWERVARQTIGVYHEALDRESPSTSVNSHMSFERWKTLKHRTHP